MLWGVLNKVAFFRGDLDQDQRSKICLSSRSDESTLVMDSLVPLMHHDPDRSWITDPDPDLSKETQLKFEANTTV